VRIKLLLIIVSSSSPTCVYNKKISYRKQIVHQHLCHKMFWPWREVKGKGKGSGFI